MKHMRDNKTESASKFFEDENSVERPGIHFPCRLLIARSFLLRLVAGKRLALYVTRAASAAMNASILLTYTDNNIGELKKRFYRADFVKFPHHHV